LDLVTRIFCDPGDVVLAEGPAYVGALSVFAAYQVEVVHVPMDGDGLVPETLADTIARMKAQGRRVKFLYTVPNFHNPAGVSLSAPRRAQILDICDRAGIPILEDNPYGLLGFDGPPAAALRSVDAENVIYLGSFSKMFASGLRVGWVLAPHGVREKLVLANEAAVLCPPNFTQLVVARYLAEHDWRAQVVRFQNLYRERRDATLGALTQMMPAGTTWTKPTGGFYVWVTLPEGLDSKAMLPRAVTARVAYVPGTAFYMGEGGRREMRLSYCYPPPERIREGVRRLTGVINSELETMATFGTSSAPAEHGIERPGPQSPSPEIR
jgi:DNA-binding transcriptional MocR family regulator